MLIKDFNGMRFTDEVTTSEYFCILGFYISGTVETFTFINLDKAWLEIAISARAYKYI